MKSKMQETTTLSVTESELVAAGSAAQDMLYEMSLGVNQIEGTTPNGIGSRQQRCGGFG
jgi:hypothetical protein